MIKYNKVVVALIFSLVLTSVLFAQNIDKDISYIRNSDALNFRSDIFIKKISLYQPVASVAAYDRWDSPSLNYFINGYKKELFPFNFRTADFLAQGININKSFKISEPQIDNLSGAIKIKSLPIPEKMKLKVHLFLGGETGDPMHQVYTTNSTLNRNKIVPSGEAALSNTTGNLSYRIFGGFYGYFTQQDKNSDLTEEINPNEFSDPNKNITAGGELNYQFENKDYLNIYTSVYKFDGFDVTPAFPVMVYMRSLNFSFYSSYYSNLAGVLFKLKGEKLTAELEKNKFHNKYEYNISKVVFDASKRLTFSKVEIDLNANVARTSAENKNGNLFADEIIRTELGFSTNINYRPSKNVTLFFNGSANKGLIDNYVNFSSGVNYKIDEIHNLELKLLTGEQNPDLFAVYGNLEITDIDKIGKVTDYRGNENLVNEQVTRVALNYSYAAQKLKFNIKPSYNSTDDMIFWKKENATVRRINSGSTSFFALKSQLDYKLTESTDFNLGYSYSEELEENYIPEHKFSFQFNYKFPFDAVLTLEGYYQSEVNWNEFEKFVPLFVREKNYDADLSSFMIFNIMWRQKMPVILGINDIEFALRCENIFDKKVKYLPMSCEFPRNLTVNLFFAL
ncbi:MAG: hypothetical protein ACEPO8_06270 [Rhodothermaceae bacterium]